MRPKNRPIKNTGVYLAGKDLWTTFNENLIVERLAPGALVGDGVLQLPLYLKSKM
jgi:hypothetical protein